MHFLFWVLLCLSQITIKIRTRLNTKSELHVSGFVLKHLLNISFTGGKPLLMAIFECFLYFFQGLVELYKLLCIKQHFFQSKFCCARYQHTHIIDLMPRSSLTGPVSLIVSIRSARKAATRTPRVCRIDVVVLKYKMKNLFSAGAIS